MTISDSTHGLQEKDASFYSKLNCIASNIDPRLSSYSSEALLTLLGLDSGCTSSDWQEMILDKLNSSLSSSESQIALDLAAMEEFVLVNELTPNDDDDCGINANDIPLKEFATDIPDKFQSRFEPNETCYVDPVNIEKLNESMSKFNTIMIATDLANFNSELDIFLLSRLHKNLQLISETTKTNITRKNIHEQISQIIYRLPDCADIQEDIKDISLINSSAVNQAK